MGNRNPPPSVEDLAAQFPDLEIIELIGAGGMGAVYKVRQPQLDRFVALKILSHDLSSDPAFAERFNREARVLARLSHANIVAIFDYGTAGPHCYLLMELVDGVNLRQAMQAGRFTPAESLAMVGDICSALQFAHEEGILHRDIKPENVLIDSKGRVKIADFGIAKLVGDDHAPDVTLTLQGSVMGSPHYMAPEQIETPGDVDQRADIYSLGVVFYELLTGELPLGRFALPSEKASMDARIDAIVLRTLEKERKARFQSADEVMTQVGAIAQNPGVASVASTTPASDDPGTARFSLASAIFTGVSLVLLILSMVLASADAMPRKLEFLVSMLVLGLSGCLGIVGIILGSVALREIRRSGGKKGGLGCAVFGVASWLILLIGVISTLFLKMPMPMQEGAPRASLGPFAILLIMVVPQVLGAFVFVRGLRRWAGGVPTGDGGRNHPGLTRTFLGVVGLTILGPVLAEVAVRVLPADEGTYSKMELEYRQALAEPKMVVSSSSIGEQVDWMNGTPEALISVTLDPGLQASFRILRTRGEEVPELTQLGRMRAVSGLQAEPAMGKIKIGTTRSAAGGGGATSGLAAMVENQGGSGALYGESNFRGWNFESEIPAQLEFSAPGLFDYPLATQGEGGKTPGTMSLEVMVSPLDSTFENE